MKKAFVFFVTAFLVLQGSLLPASEEDRVLLEKLVFPEAYDAVSSYDEELGLTVFSYKVRQKYPSKKVLEFYDEKLEELNWEKLLHPEKEGGRDWMDFIDETAEQEPLVHRLGAYWRDKGKNKIITLVLRYNSYYNTTEQKQCARWPNNSVLNVTVNIGPFSDLSETPEKTRIKK